MIKWLGKNPWKKYKSGKWGIQSAGYGGGEQILYTDEELYAEFKKTPNNSI